jgi:hypothetical protein
MNFICSKSPHEVAAETLFSDLAVMPSQGQMRNLAEQANEMGQIVSRAAIDAAKPKN